MSVPTKEVPLSQPGLAERMAASLAGQITFADLTLPVGTTCLVCRFYQDGGKKAGKHKGFGRCALVKAHTKKPGPLFNGKAGRACTKMERRT